MAIVASSGKRISPAGPSRWYPGGSVYDRGAAAWSEALGEMGVDVARKDEKIRAAEETTQRLRRVSGFALGMAQVQIDAGKIQDPLERENFFKARTEELRQKAMDWKGARPEAAAQLEAAITGNYTQEHVKFMHGQEALRLGILGEDAKTAWATAISTDNQALADMALDDLVEAEVITPKMREQRKAGFKTDVRIEKLRQGSVLNPETSISSLQDMLTEQTITQEQQARINTAIEIAREQQRKKRVADDFVQEEIKRGFVDLLGNLEDPTKPQLTINAITQSNLDAADQVQFVNILKSWERDLFEDQPKVLADLMQKQQRGELRNPDVWSMVGKGLSPKTAAGMTDPDSFYSDWGFKEADKFLKGNLNYTEMMGWEYPEGQFAYSRAMKDIRDAIAKADPPVRGEKLTELAVRIAVPYLTEFWANVMSKNITDETVRSKLLQELRTLGGTGLTPTRGTGGDIGNPVQKMTEQQKAKEIFGIE